MKSSLKRSPTRTKRHELNRPLGWRGEGRESCTWALQLEKVSIELQLLSDKRHSDGIELNELPYQGATERSSS